MFMHVNCTEVREVIIIIIIIKEENDYSDVRSGV